MAQNDQMDTGPSVPKGKPGNKRKYAVITAIIVIVSGLSIYAVINNADNQTATPSVSVAGQVATVGSHYNFTLNTKKQFSSISVFFGDGTSQTIKYQSSTDVNVSHVYNSPGNYLIFYEVNYNGHTYVGSKNLIPVEATQASIPAQTSTGLLSLNLSDSSQEVVNHTYTFAPGSHVSFSVGYYTPPANASYQVISQSANVLLNTTSQKTFSYPYTFSSGNGYTLGRSNAYLNLSSLKEGVYAIGLKTTTAFVQNDTTGALNSSVKQYNTTYYVDLAVFSNANVVSQNSGSVFVNAELENGGYSKLDPATVFDTVSYELLQNMYQQLVMFNGSSEKSFNPMLATNLPSVSNGEINSNYANYTLKTPSGVPYTVHLQPYENYTFHIRNSSKWQNGQPVTAWDVMYSLTRTLLFSAGSPTTPAYIQAPLMLPGNYLKTNTFYNITTNMTVDNATNSITFHFQQPESPNLVFQTFDNYGSQITSANWLIAHGAGITWTPAGFLAYEKQGSISDYNTYVQNHVISDGPYKIAYIVPSSQVVLVSNPDFVSPGSWYPAAKINKIVIDYVSQPSTISVMLQSNQSQSGQIPTSDWGSVMNLQNQGKVKVLSFVTPSIYWFNFNAQVNTTLLHKMASQENMPSNLFTDHNVRKTFAYSFNYQFYLNDQLGNPAYPNLNVGKQFAGFLEQGMNYYQSVSDLNNTTGGNVPYFNLHMAKQYWSDFMSSAAGKVNIVNTSNGIMYNNKPLNIPIFVLKNDFSGPIAVSTWATNLQKIIPGIQIEVVKVSFPEWLSLSINGQNPMTIFPGNWIPSLTTATSNLGPLAYPSSSLAFQTMMSTFWMGGGNSTITNVLGNSSQAAKLTEMQTYYNDAAASSNKSVREKYFHMMNAELVNMTMDIYLYQSYENRVVSTSINSTSITAYNQNPLIAGTGNYFYNYLSYN